MIECVPEHSMLWDASFIVQAEIIDRNASGCCCRTFSDVRANFGQMSVALWRVVSGGCRSDRSAAGCGAMRTVGR